MRAYNARATRAIKWNYMLLHNEEVEIDEFIIIPPITH